MGPPLFRGGRVLGSITTGNAALGFNGAASLQRRKGPVRLDPSHLRPASMGPPLFRGGRKEGIYQPWTEDVASMRPPLFRGGRYMSPREKEFQVARLQWGRLSSEAEGRKQVQLLFAQRRFNGAASLQRRKVMDGWETVKVKLTLQWGRLSSEAEGAKDLVHRLGNRLASMGPPLFRGGRRVAVGGDGQDVAASMGPPLFRGGRTSTSTS